MLGKVLLGDLLKQLFLVSAAQNVDLGHSHRVQELLDHAKSAREAPGRVDDVQFAQSLGVVVLADGRGLLQVTVGAAHHADANTLEVHDGARSLEKVTGLARAGGQTGVGHLLVLYDKVRQHALVGGDLAHGVEVDLAELLDVERSAILVGLVVVLRVVGEDLGFLLVVEVGNQVVKTAVEGSAPLLAVDEPVS